MTAGQAMFDASKAASDFDAAFRAGATAGLRVRAEDGADEAFLRELFVASWPLRDMLPEPLRSQQIDLHLAAFRRGLPDDVMRRIVVDPTGTPIGRLIIDWRHAAGSYCADIAVLPQHGGRGVGTALLRAWIATAAAHGLDCALTVAPDNPARALYARLGFQEQPQDFVSAGVEMRLAPPG
jgi:ribosomal protein S18 acetylase RimI-like enzyme